VSAVFPYATCTFQPPPFRLFTLHLSHTLARSRVRVRPFPIARRVCLPLGRGHPPLLLARSPASHSPSIAQAFVHTHLPFAGAPCPGAVRAWLCAATGRRAVWPHRHSAPRQAAVCGLPAATEEPVRERKCSRAAAALFSVLCGSTVHGPLPSQPVPTQPPPPPPGPAAPPPPFLRFGDGYKLSITAVSGQEDALSNVRAFVRAAVCEGAVEVACQGVSVTFMLPREGVNVAGLFQVRAKCGRVPPRRTPTRSASRPAPCRGPRPSRRQCMPRVMNTCRPSQGSCSNTHVCAAGGGKWHVWRAAWACAVCVSTRTCE
jgi:hypothetical protein